MDILNKIVDLIVQIWICFIPISAKPGLGSSGTKPFSYTAGGVKPSPGLKQPDFKVHQNTQMDGRIGNVGQQLKSPLHYGSGSNAFPSMDEKEQEVVVEPVGKKTLTFTTASYKYVNNVNTKCIPVTISLSRNLRWK